jgi:hypothetical protein
MQFENPRSKFLAAAGDSAGAGAVFLVGERAGVNLLAQFIEARLLSALTVGISPARRKIRFALFGFGRGAVDHRAGAAAIWI